MSRTYKDKEGNHLALDERAGKVQIGWFLADEQDFGAYLGEEIPAPKPPKKEKERFEARELRAAFQAVAPFAFSGGDGSPFLFETEREARRALQAANAALLGLKEEWPSWATTALAAGWKPPKGWKP